MLNARVVRRCSWRSRSRRSAAATAQDWPNRPIHFIVPYPAGGSTDIGARAIADHLSRVLGQQVVVENKSGGSGNVGFEFAAKSAPDGYTVLIAPDQVTSAPHVFKVSFDPLKDFVPVDPAVAAAGRARGAIPSSASASFAELIALAKAEARHELRHLAASARSSTWWRSGSPSSPASSSSTCPIAAAARRSTIWSRATSRSPRSAPRRSSRITRPAR